MPKGSMKKKQNKSILRQAWQNIMSTFGIVQRSMAMDRVYMQMWDQLDETAMENGEEFAFPLNMFVGDDGSSLFSLVTRGGKLYQVPVSVSHDTVILGEWTQVEEVFRPIIQSRFSVRRQKDGTHRWFGIAATSVINRDGEIDSTELFDSFISRIENGECPYPTLDFYHMGQSNPEKWDFGAADYVARDGVCYIASGTFYEDHPLAKAAIRVMSSKERDKWGHSIEFYADEEPTTLRVQPEVQIPMYIDGENTRISMVLEADASGLFTRMLNVSNQKEERSMNKRVQAAMEKLFGDDEDAMLAFIENVDTVNKRVKDEKLVSRSSKTKDALSDPNDKDDDDSDDEDDKDDEDETDAEDATEDPKGQAPAVLELDEVGMTALVSQISQSKEFKALIQPFQQTIADLQAQAVESKTVIAGQTKDITRLKKTNIQLVERVNALSAEEGEKKKTWQQDLPSRRTVQATYRPSQANQGDDDDEDDEDSDGMKARAERTLSHLPSY